MKKILFSILTILGIGLSFCSSTDYTVNFFNSSYTLKSYNDRDYGTVYDNVVFNTSLDMWSSFGADTFYYPSFSLSGINSDIFLKNICFYVRDNSDFYLYKDTNLVGTTLDNNLVCFDLSNFNINLKDSGYNYFNIYTTAWFNSYQHSFIGSSPTPLFYSAYDNSYYYSFSGLFSDFPDLVLNLYGQSINGDVFGIPYSITFSIESLPKFKVNYGNTSYEYELNDNLSIYLKSPVIQNGNTFTYNGKTGLNLFFNGTSQWYDKSNLYLESMFWYNNNIFTPICL